jgi:hypothetical protein
MHNNIKSIKKFLSFVIIFNLEPKIFSDKVNVRSQHSTVFNEANYKIFKLKNKKNFIMQLISEVVLQ